MQTLAVIDLGTNTFHLLIAAPDTEGGFRTIHRERRFVKLAEEGIGTIGTAAYQRGLNAMLAYKEILSRYQVDDCKAFGTAALRTASNGQAFIEEVALQTGISVQLIDGQREAALIHKGVKLAVPFNEEPQLIMDIGGGSVEFIIANRSEVYWSYSFPIGIGVLYKEFHHSDPILATEKETLFDYLRKTLQPLQQALLEWPVKQLVGASGTFDVIETMVTDGNQRYPYSEVSIDYFPKIRDQIVNSDLDERLAIRHLPGSRADMIVVALLLIDFIIDLAAIDVIRISAFAMKEGILSEMLTE